MVKEDKRGEEMKNKTRGVSNWGSGKSSITFHFPGQRSWRYRFDYGRVDIEKRSSKWKKPIYKIDVYAE